LSIFPIKTTLLDLAVKSSPIFGREFYFSFPQYFKCSFHFHRNLLRFFHQTFQAIGNSFPGAAAEFCQQLVMMQKEDETFFDTMLWYLC
jgi:hypothetical protein